MTTSSQKSVTMIFSVDGGLVNCICFFFGTGGRGAVDIRHCIHCSLHSVSNFGSTFLSLRELLTSLSYRCKRSMPLSLQLLAFLAVPEYRRRNIHVPQWLSLYLYCLFQQIWWDIIQPSLHNGLLASVHQPEGCCQTSLQGKCDYSAIVIKCCYSCFSFFNPSYPSLNSINFQISFTIHSEQTFVNDSGFSAFASKKLFNARGFKGTTASALSESAVVVPSVK